MTIKRIISALLVVVLGVAFVVPSFALTPAEDSGEVLGIDDVNGDFVPADEVGEDGIMSLAASAPSGYTSVHDAFSIPAQDSILTRSQISYWSDHTRPITGFSCNVGEWNTYTGDWTTSYPLTVSLFLARSSKNNTRFPYVYFFMQVKDSVAGTTTLYGISVCSFPSSMRSEWDSLPRYSPYGEGPMLSKMYYIFPSPSQTLPDLLQSPTAIADSIASSPSAVQSLAGALAEAGLGGSDPNEIWGQSLVANNHIYVTNGSYSLGNFTAAGALDNLMNNIAYSVPFGLTGTLVNVNGIYPTGTHDGPTVSVGSVSTSPLQALLDAIIYSPLTTAKRWVWNGSLEPPTLESTSTITESQAMAENFHSLGVFLNNENTAIKSLISSEVGFGSFDIHEITSDGVVTITHENVGSIVGALSVMSNDITGMLSNLGFVLADPDDIAIKQQTKAETEAARETLYGDNGLSKSDNFKQSNDLGSVAGILTPQYNVKDIAGATDNENLWAWFSAETWATAFNVPSVLAEGDEDEPLYQPDSEKWGSAEWKFGDR